MVYQLIYTSTAETGVTPGALADIARTARIKNTLLGVTGLLLCHNGTILQILEGEQAVVKKLYDHIAKDTRHKNCLIMTERDIDAPEFSSWSMGFRGLSDVSDSESYFKLTLASLGLALPEAASAELKAMSHSFTRVSGLAREAS